MDKHEIRKQKDEIVKQKSKEARIVRRIVFPLTTAIFILLFGILTGGYLYVNKALQPLDPDSNKMIEVEIPLGSGINAISDLLEENKVIKDGKIFKYYVKFKNEHGFQAGKYQLTPSMTFDEIIASLKTGKVYKEAQLTITIPEGLQLKEIAKIISDKTDYTEDEIMEVLNSEEFIQSQMNNYPTIITDEILQDNIKFPLEGYLFPATYSYTEEQPPIEDLLQPMLDKTADVVTQYYSDIEGKEMTVHEVLTMASLIEEEATNEADRKTISSVFYNRMEMGMPLQTDPTVLYAMGKHKERLYYKDYDFQDPYNTYQINGLPPGPIANAGNVSIEAALYPSSSDYYYFLATKSGEVLFSETHEEHVQKSQKYIGQ